MRRRLVSTLGAIAAVGLAYALVAQALPFLFQDGQPASAGQMNANVDALEEAHAAMREVTIAARRLQAASRERLAHVEVGAFASAPSGLRASQSALRATSRAVRVLAPQQTDPIPPFMPGELVDATEVNAMFDALEFDVKNLDEFLRLLVEREAAEIDARTRAVEAELGLSSPAPIDASLEALPEVEPIMFQAGAVMAAGDVNASFAQLDAAQIALATQVDRAEALVGDLDVRIEALAEELGYPSAELVACADVTNPDFNVTNLQLAPASPATLGFGDLVDVRLEFEIALGQLPDALSYVNIWAMPYYEGSSAIGSRHQASPPITATSGSVGRYFEFDEAEDMNGRVDQVRILIQARAEDTTYGGFGPYLVWCAQDVDYQFE